jgi:hypothetical protein
MTKLTSSHMTLLRSLEILRKSDGYKYGAPMELDCYLLSFGYQIRHDRQASVRSISLLLRLLVLGMICYSSLHGFSSECQAGGC